MAGFVQGEYITASKMNEINTSTLINFSKTLSGGPSNISYSSPQYYCHGTGKVVHAHGSYGAFGGIEMYLQKLENGSWVTKSTLANEADLFGGSYNKTVNNDWGDGFFRVNGKGSVNVKPNADFYPAQKNCTVGDKLTIYDAFGTSGNRLAGSFITVDLLNSGRGGTF